LIDTVSRHLQSFSARTKFILSLILISAVFQLGLLLIYPGYIAGKIRSQVLARNEKKIIQYLSFNYDKYEDKKLILENVFQDLQKDPENKVVLIFNNDTTIQDPINSRLKNSLMDADSSGFLQLDTERLLITKISYPQIDSVEKVKIIVGLDSGDLDYHRIEAQRLIIYLSLVSFLAIYIVSLLYNQTTYLPLKKLGNYLKILSSSKQKISGQLHQSSEFKEYTDNLKNISQKISDLRKQKKDMPRKLSEAVEKAQKVQNELDIEVKKMSALVLLSIRLNKESDRLKILKQINQEITGELNFQFSAVFVHDKNSLKYQSSRLKGMAVLNKKLAKELKNYVMGYDSPEYKEISKGNSYVTSRPHFHQILDQNNITVQLAMVPISTAAQLKGMLVVGYLGKEQKLDESDLETLTLLGNILALNIENLEAIANLSRNVQLRTEELETTNKLLSESIMERDNMLKLVSHDLNAPLRNVIGLVDSIYRKYKGELPEDLIDRIDRIRNNIDKERRMIKDVLLNFRALEADSADEEINMYDLMLSIKDELQHELEKKSIEFIIPENLPKFKARQFLIRHIFLNLVDNASKYLPEEQSGNKIQIDAKDSIDEITYSVTDNGTGIPQDKQLDIFRSYKSLQGLRELEFTGLGLGLALVKNIVEKMSGRIWVKSKPGEGTTFFISFRKGKFEQIARK